MIYKIVVKLFFIAFPRAAIMFIVGMIVHEKYLNVFISQFYTFHFIFISSWSRKKNSISQDVKVAA